MLMELLNVMAALAKIYYSFDYNFYVIHIWIKIDLQPTCIRAYSCSNIGMIVN